MEEANKKASDAVFNAKNAGRDDHTIDLHGLYVEEAVNRARQAIQQAKGEVGSVVLNALVSAARPPLQMQPAAVVS
jgi:dsDNA-specific endonuclease/ATPase MutS2